MTTVFWDSHAVILIDYLQKGRTITGEYYSDLLLRFDAVLKTVSFEAKKSATTLHSFRIVLSKLNELRYALVSHLPY